MFRGAMRRARLWHFSTRAYTRIKMASELDSTLESADVVVFSYGGCPYCRKVTRGFDAEGIKYREVDYDDWMTAKRFGARSRRGTSSARSPRCSSRGSSWAGATTAPSR